MQPCESAVTDRRETQHYLVCASRMAIHQSVRMH